MTIKQTALEQLQLVDIDVTSNSRFPYTLHHDYVRMNCKVCYLSRSDVAKLPYDEDQLWAACFIQAIEEMTTIQKLFSKIDPDFYVQCVNIADQHVKELNALLIKPCF